MITVLRKETGFTLTELIVGLAVTAIVVLVASGILSRMSDEYDHVKNRAEVEREALAVISQMRMDVASATRLKECCFERSEASWPMDRVGFFSLEPGWIQSDKGFLGDLCVLTYDLRDIQLAGKTVRCLVRSFRQSADTYPVFKTSNHESAWDPLPSDEPLAHGVLSFHARPQFRDVSGHWQDWDSSMDCMPEVLDVRFVFVKGRLWNRLRTTEDWDGSVILGDPAAASRHKDLVVYRSKIAFGVHEKF